MNMPSTESRDAVPWKDIQTLAERVVNSTALAFVGAGSSRRLGYPTWAGLLDNLREYVLTNDLMSAEEIEQLETDTADDPVWLTSAFRHRIETNEWQDFIARHFQPWHADPGEFHTDLIKIPFRHFLTTNLDEVLEWSHNKIEGDPPRSVAWDNERDFNEFLARMNDPTYKRRYVHLHGIAADLREVVLTEEDYLRRYEDLTTLLRLFAVFSTQTVAFIGFSLSDPDFMSMLRRIRSHGSGIPRHFAFLPKPSSTQDAHIRERLTQRYGITPIFYRSDDRDDHEDLDNLLRRLRAQVDELEPQSATTRLVIRSNVHLALADPHSDREGLEMRVREAIYGGRPRVVSLWGSHGAGKTTLAKSLAARYTDVPGRTGARFSHVVWICPETFGLVGSPEANPPDESIVAGIFAEIASMIGRDRLHARVGQSAATLVELLGESPTLVVIDRFERLRGDELSKAIRYFLTMIPEKSFLIVTCRDDGVLDDDEIPHTAIKVSDFDDKAAGDFVRKLRNEFGGGHAGSIDDVVQAASGRPLLLRWLSGLEELPPSLADWRPEELERESFSTIVEQLSGDAKTLLATLTVFVISHSRESLRALTGLPLPAIHSAVNRLAEVGFVDRDSVEAPVNLKGVVRDYVVDSDAEVLGEELTKAIARLARWAFDQFEDRPEWEQDASQKNELVEALPDLRAAVQLAGRFPTSLSSGFLATLNLRIAQLLHREGRWAEAGALARRLIQAEPHGDAAIDAELLLARHLAHEGRQDQRKLDDAQQLIDEAISAIAAKRDQDESLNERDVARYEGLAMKAEMRLGHLRSRSSWIESREHLRSAIEGSRGRFPKTYVDAVGYLAELLIANDDHDEALDLLKEAEPVIASLGGTRLAAHHAQLRADAYRRGGDLTVARRYFARALILSQPWYDARLRARCLQGLAVCDSDIDAANRALEIFRGFGLSSEAAETQELFPEIAAGADIKHVPFVFLVGPPGSGKALVRSYVTETLLNWGHDIQLLTLAEVYNAERAGDRSDDGFAYERYGDLFAIHSRTELARRSLHELGQHCREYQGQIGAVIEFTPADLRSDFETIGFDLLSGSLCLHFTATRAERIRRNRVRTRDWFPEEVVEKFPDSPAESGYDFLRQYGAAHDEIDASGTSTSLRARVRESLALSFAPSQLLEAWPSSDEGARRFMRPKREAANLS